MDTIRRCTVYGLRSSSDPEIRYIGQTFYSLSNRLKRHRKEARSGDQTPRSRWIRKVIAGGERVEIVPIEENAVWNEAEIRWIAHYRAASPRLLNITAGGQGAEAGVKKSKETRRRMSAAQRKSWADPQYREKTVAAIREERRSTEGRERLAEIQRNAWGREDVRQRRIESIQRAARTDEFRAKMRENALRQMADPDMKARISEAHRERMKDPAARAEAAENARKGWQDPIKRAARIAALRAAKQRRKIAMQAESQTACKGA